MLIGNSRTTFHRQLLTLASVIAVPASMLVMPTAVAQELTPGHVEHELNPNNPAGLQRFIVKYRDNGMMHISAEQQEDSLQKAASEASASAETVKVLHDGARAIKMDHNLSVEEADAFLDSLAADPRVEYAQQDSWVFPMAAPNDPMYAKQWNLHDAEVRSDQENIVIPGEYSADADKAWDLGVTGQGQTIAVIDTGITKHPDLDSKVLPGYDMISDATISRDGDGRDNNPQDEGNWNGATECGNGLASDSSWHGSHVAGVAAAVTNNGQGVAGMAPDAKILPLRVMGRCGGLGSDMTDAMVWAAGGDVAGLPKNNNPASVINLSMGAQGKCIRDQAFIDAIAFANSKGATVLAAAGNSDDEALWYKPASCEGVITVGAVGPNGKRAWYSSYGPEVDIAAQGGDHFAENSTYRIHDFGVWSAVSDSTTTPGNPTYGSQNGTSQATPMVAGAVAMLKQAKPGITNDEIMQVLQGTSMPFAEDTSAKPIGAGILNVGAAVAKVLGTTVPTTSAPATSTPATTAPGTTAPGSTTTKTVTTTPPAVTVTAPTQVVTSTQTVTKTSVQPVTEVVTSTTKTTAPAATVTLTETSTSVVAPITVTATETITAPATTESVTSTGAPVTVTETAIGEPTVVPSTVTETAAPETSTVIEDGGTVVTTVSATTTAVETTTEPNVVVTETQPAPVVTVTETQDAVTQTLVPVTVTDAPAPVTVTKTTKVTVPQAPVTQTQIVSEPNQTVTETPGVVVVTSTAPAEDSTTTVTPTSVVTETEIVETTAVATTTQTSVVDEGGVPVPVVTETITTTLAPKDTDYTLDIGPIGSSWTDNETGKTFSFSSLWLFIPALAAIFQFFGHIPFIGGSSSNPWIALTSWFRGMFQ
ncbi:S8 family peptidase [Corynebacterium sp. H130]|uniref:S8 family peptidase n=1 Tax=Corynebacterium sp. H130 TaxID=3133444 RepID=UPI0030B330E4